jgi:hypothetical protein
MQALLSMRIRKPTGMRRMISAGAAAGTSAMPSAIVDSEEISLVKVSN